MTSLNIHIISSLSSAGHLTKTRNSRDETAIGGINRRCPASSFDEFNVIFGELRLARAAFVRRRRRRRENSPPCPWYRTRASSRGISGKEVAALSRERWSTKRGKPGQLAPRVHLRLIQCIIPTPAPSLRRSPFGPPATRWLTEKRSPRNARIDPLPSTISSVALSSFDPRKLTREICRRLTPGDDEVTHLRPCEGACAISRNRCTGWRSALRVNKVVRVPRVFSPRYDSRAWNATL